MKKNGKKIIEKRISMELTQAELAKKSKISTTTLSAWECNGIGNAIVKNALKVSQALNTKIEDLL